MDNKQKIYKELDRLRDFWSIALEGSDDFIDTIKNDPPKRANALQWRAYLRGCLNTLDSIEKHLNKLGAF